MQQWPYYILVALIAYLLGSLNFALLVSKLVFKKDIREYGSGNAGATNSLRMMGKKWALVVSLGDFAKGMAAALIGKAVIIGLETIGFTLGNDDAMWGMAIAGLFVVLGHCYPLYFHFRGGKGVWATGGVLVVFDWRAVLVAVAVFIVVVAITRYVSLGSISAGVSVTVSMVLFGDLWKYVVVTAVLCGMVIAKHKDNIKRLLAGTEKRLSLGRRGK